MPGPRTARGSTRGAAVALVLLVACAVVHAGAAAADPWEHHHPSSNSSDLSQLQVNETCRQAAQDGRETCPLWGCDGELWRRDGALSDWTFAGYGAGLEAIPSPPVTVDVKRDFGAAGNGLRDDTAAFKAAIEATKAAGGVIFVPPGKYIISEQLVLNSYQVLRGGGRDTTNLRFTKALVDLDTKGWGTNYTAGVGASRFTWSGGLLTNQKERGVFDPKVNLHLGFVAQPAKRGDTRVYVGQLVRNTSSADLLLKPGDWFTIGMAENERGDMARMLYNNKTAGGASLRTFARNFMMSHMTRVVAVGRDWIEMERPLHVDISLKHPTVLVKTANYKATGIGIEDMEVSFPWTAYKGHHEEPGYNAIELVGAINCWVRRVRVTNADSGVRLFGSLFNTVSDVEVGVSPWSRKGGRWAGRDHVWQLADMDGHMGIALHWASHDNLVEKFNITGTYYHDLLVAAYSSRNVFSQGRGTDVCMDHHGAAPNNNLWTDIDVGLGQGAMRWSGDGGSNPFAGKLNTFWGVWASNLPTKVDYVGQLASARLDSHKARQGARLAMMQRSADIQGYQQVVVDMPLDSQMPTIRDAGDWIVHYNPDVRVWPPNLYKAMRATSRSRLAAPPNGRLLSELFPRPSAAAWKPGSPPAAAQAAPAPAGPGSSRSGVITDDPDCLNLGCQGLTGHASWVRPVLTEQVSASEHLGESRLAALLPHSLRGLGGLNSSGSSSSDGSAAASLLAPVTAAASDLLLKLKQVAGFAGGLLAKLSGSSPAQQRQQQPGSSDGVDVLLQSQPHHRSALKAYMQQMLYAADAATSLLQQPAPAPASR